MAFRRQGTRRGGYSGVRGGGYKPSRVWLPLAGNPFSSVTVTTASALYGLQAPAVTIGTQLTADPPEDVTILRLMVDWTVQLAAGPVQWTLAFTVQDTAWTPSATAQLDGDKRFLWMQTYSNLQAASSAAYHPPGVIDNGAGIIGGAYRDNVTRVDISPKVRIEAGKALYLVGYLQGGSGALSVNMHIARLLYQQSGRRR